MAKLKAADTKAIAQSIAELHTVKKVVKPNLKPDEMNRHDYVPVKTVHVLMPSRGAFVDCTPEDEEKLKDYAMENDQSIHVFTHEEIAAEKEEIKAKKAKKD